MYQDLLPPYKSKANLAFTPFAPHHICYGFGPDLLTFALRKYGANPFFLPVINFFFQIAESVPLKEACLLGCCVPTGYGAAVNVAKVCVKSVLRLSVIYSNLR